jgi:protoheme IX farnesyltransferase
LQGITVEDKAAREQLVIDTRAGSMTVSRLQVLPRLNDYAQLTKARVTSLIVVTAWCGFFFGCQKAGISSISWTLLHALLGIAMVSSGTAALNEVMEHDVDSKMRRTALRPIPAGRMSLLHGTVLGLLLTVGGSIYLVFFTNWLTGVLTFLTSVVYLAAYTPLKRVSPVCTFVGAIPGAMPGVLGWTAARGQLDWGTAVLFAILFLWQFPHFFAIAWIYREDYAKGSIRMLPVVEPDGRSTSLRIILYSLALVPVSLLPVLLGMTGRIYLVGAMLLGVSLLYFGARLTRLGLPVNNVASKVRARHLFQCSIVYLPMLFALMMSDSLVR